MSASSRNSDPIRAPGSVVAERSNVRIMLDAEQLFEQLRDVSFDGVGVTRDSFGPNESAAHWLIAEYALKAGLDVQTDRVGNTVITLDGQDTASPFIATGSHLDSVPRGGNFDGAAGVVAGLLAMKYLKEYNRIPPRSIKLFALRGEESAWFGKSWIGSHALFGLLTPQDLALRRFDSDRTLKSYFEEISADVDAIEAGEPLLDPATVHAFVEVHIEQGPVLHSKGVSLGIVSSIYGNLRHRRMECRGVAAHSGATPRDLRHDSVVGLADFIMRVDQRWKEWLEQGRQLVVTHGVIGTNPLDHAISRVPGEAHCTVEIRAEDDAVLDGFHKVIQEEARRVAQARGLTFEFDRPIMNPAAPMDPVWQRRLETFCTEREISHMTLPSGAGHDAAVFAQCGIPTAMLFIRNDKGSHNPDESMELEDFACATEVLMDVFQRPV